MNEKLMARSGGKCELCQKETELVVYTVQPEAYADNEVAVCKTLVGQIEGVKPLNPDAWRFLPDAMWSEVRAVQVLAWRMLNRLKGESWAAEALDILYLDDETLAWAKAVGELVEAGEAVVHKDANGNVLQNGDSVVLTKTLDVKGSNLSAKLGTVVKNIRLVEDNPEQIEGRVEGQLIVILTKYLRKQS
ncbi:PhnA domain-containing protein [Parapedobacter sp. ISTM3]|uniref:PhnA domain-containing protein n=1 Tax=Parapedobacter sp. ISTM3 TaxID=2800130 RepID=UPI001905E2BA|nr:alkylphosphonate utilization protein [Parapedobacter sp. ISTM3]MBK1441177.1 PhnA domain-containing protein [Parapedobacter sp. ISTM3]